MMLSVVVATRDRAGFLDRALQSLSTQTDAPPFEAIVVDNGSSDATPQVVEHHKARAQYELNYLYEERPNRAAARNRGIAIAQGDAVVFVDDDVWLPPQFLHAHAGAQGEEPAVVSGPILNVGSYHDRPKPKMTNFSRAFFCTCNVSVPLRALAASHGFDERFNLYGWEDTELGMRLREHGLRARFCWDAYLYHIKPVGTRPLAQVMRQTVEKAAMAARFVRKNPSKRARLATGAYGLNLLRGRLMSPRWALAGFASIAADERLPGAVRSAARTRLLDGMYVHELVRGLTR